MSTFDLCDSCDFQIRVGSFPTSVTAAVVVGDPYCTEHCWRCAKTEVPPPSVDDLGLCAECKANLVLTEPT